MKELNFKIYERNFTILPISISVDQDHRSTCRSEPFSSATTFDTCPCQFANWHLIEKITGCYCRATLKCCTKNQTKLLALLIATVTNVSRHFYIQKYGFSKLQYTKIEHLKEWLLRVGTVWLWTWRWRVRCRLSYELWATLLSRRASTVPSDAIATSTSDQAWIRGKYH